MVTTQEDGASIREPAVVIENPAGEHVDMDPGGFLSQRAQKVVAFEKDYFSRLLNRHRGDVSRAAREAQLPRGTLYRLLKKYDLNPRKFRAL